MDECECYDSEMVDDEQDNNDIGDMKTEGSKQKEDKKPVQQVVPGGDESFEDVVVIDRQEIYVGRK